MPRWPEGTWHREPGTRELAGLDVFVESPRDAAMLAESLRAAVDGSAFELGSISNRGVQVWPTSGETFVVDHFHCRFPLRGAPSALGADENAAVTDLLTRIGREHRWMHVEKLQRFDGQDGFARAQGEG